MNSKSLVGLAVTAAVLGGAAVLLSNGTKNAPAKLNGCSILPDLNLAGVVRIEIGDKLKLAAGSDGWTLESSYGYPADRNKIVENLMKLAELKVGQVARGRKAGSTTAVVLKDSAGKPLAELKLGDKHQKKASGQMAMYGGGYADGRYLEFKGETVLVKEPLEEFDGDFKSWCNPRIASFSSSDVLAVAYRQGKESVELEKGTNGVWKLAGLKVDEELDTSKTYSLDSALSYLDFTSVVDPQLAETELGFATGHVYQVTMKDGSNTVTHVATVGNQVKNGSDRYFRLDDGKWIFTISSYAAENMMKTRKDLVKAKEKPAEKSSADPKSETVK